MNHLKQEHLGYVKVNFVYFKTQEVSYKSISSQFQRTQKLAMDLT